MVAVAGAALSACGTVEFTNIGRINAQDERCERFLAGFMPEYWHTHPAAGIANGWYADAEFLQPETDAWRQGEVAWLDKQLHAVDSFDPAFLDANHKADLALLRQNLKAERWYITTFKPWQWDPSYYSVAASFDVLLQTDFAPLSLRLRTVMKRLAQIPAYYDAARANVSRPTLEHTDLAIEQNQGSLATFGDDLVARARASGLTTEEKAAFERDVLAARSAITGYVDFLKAMRPAWAAGPTRSFRIGQAMYDQKFANDLDTGTTAEALYQRALKEKAWLHDQMAIRAAPLWPREFPDEPMPTDRLVMIGRVLDKLSLQHAKREDLVQTVREQVPRLEAFVREKNLVTQDATRPLVVRETPLYERGGGNGASVDAPGPYDPTRDTFFNVTPLDADTPGQAESFLREYNRWMLQILTIHEAIPGHYTQLLHANKSPSIVKSVFGDGAMVEGWAVYGERMMLTAGYGDDSPEMWLFWMKWNLRSVCNTLLDYAVHTQGMTREAAMDMMQREAFQQEAEASDKWHRLTLSSVQLTSYYAGYSAIWQFREEEQQRLGALFDLKAFHDQFLSYGSAPVPMIETLMREAR